MEEATAGPKTWFSTTPYYQSVRRSLSLAVWISFWVPIAKPQRWPMPQWFSIGQSENERLLGNYPFVHWMGWIWLERGGGVINILGWKETTKHDNIRINILRTMCFQLHNLNIFNSFIPFVICMWTHNLIPKLASSPDNTTQEDEWEHIVGFHVSWKEFHCRLWAVAQLFDSFLSIKFRLSFGQSLPSGFPLRSASEDFEAFPLPHDG